MGKSINKARNKLALSKLDSQRELISEDLDISQLAFITRKLPTMRFDESVTNGEVVRTIEGASIVVMTVNDHYGLIKRSGRLAQAVDIKIDGLWFRLVKVRKQGEDIQLTFENREIAVLRTYNERRVIGYGKMRRARFIQILVQEVKEFRIPFECPDLKKPKQVKDKPEKAKERAPGFGFGDYQEPKYDAPGKFGLTIKGQQASRNQLDNLEQMLDVGLGMLLKRKLLVCAVMTVIQESSANNLPFGHSSSVGMFQEIDIWGSVAERMNIPRASKRFFDKAVAYDRVNPSAEYWEVCQAAQRSAFPKAYAAHRKEAERIVTAFGVAGGDLGTSSDVAAANWQVPIDESDIDKYQFTRGRSKILPGGRRGWEKEDSWECILRLAAEVNWRAFEVSGTVYFTTDTHLFKSAPRMRISENSDGVDWIDFDYDIGKKNAVITVTARLNRWAAPPGTIIEIFDSGPANGRWLITEIRRSLFDPKATITCKKPRPRLPEPKKEDITGLWDNQADSKEYVPSPGFSVDAPGKQPTGKTLRDAVLNSAQITFTRTSQKNDIVMGLVNDQLLQFLLAFTEAGFPATITSLRSDHSKYTSGGRVSAHSTGNAVDIGNYTDRTQARTRQAMNWIRSNQVVLGLSQLIGPIDELVVPVGHYDSSTLEGHDDHLHVGW